VISRTNPQFHHEFARLPARVKRQARSAYRRFKENPHHPGLRFKKLPPFDDIWSLRINDSHRAVGRRRGEEILWFFIGTHGEYDALLKSL
jgi:hypothetical protein